MIIKDLNENAIFDQLLTRKWITAPTLAREMGLPISTAVSVIRRMTERGIIRRGDDMQGKRGRPLAAYFSVLPYPLIACIVEGTSITAAQIGTDLSVEGLRTITKSSKHRTRDWVEDITQLIQSVVNGTDIPEVVLCVNAVEVDGQTLTSSVVPGISEVIGRLVASKLPIRVEWAHWPVLLAAYRQLEDSAPDPMMLLHVADGVSAHCMVGGTVFRGGSGLAGELGHVVVNENGPPCGCGRTGCLEACCSGPAICEKILSGLEKGVVSGIDKEILRELSPVDAMEVIWQSWLAGDDFIRHIMDQVFDQLAWALGMAINLIDPKIVVTAGYVLEHRTEWLKEIERRMQRWIVHASRRKIQFVESQATLANILQTAALQHFYRETRVRGSAHSPKQETAITVLAEQHLQRLLGEMADKQTHSNQPI